MSGVNHNLRHKLSPTRWHRPAFCQRLQRLQHAIVRWCRGEHRARRWHQRRTAYPSKSATETLHSR